jgi:hypothetical protein
MKRYIKDGKIKHRNEIVIRKDGMNTYNPTEEMILADGWEEYITPSVEPIVEKEEEYSPLDNTIEYPVPEVSDKAAFVRARHKLRNKIQQYDSSSEVNIFYMNGTPMWLDKATRAGLMLRLQAEQTMGKETTTLWYGANQYSLPIGMAMQMLLAIEIYASECYDNTQRHLAAVNALQTIDEMESYDYRAGYPEKLEF